MNKILSWLKYHTITACKRHYAHKLYVDRIHSLNGLIRPVINFNEKKNAINASIRYREFIIMELDHEGMEHTNEILSTLRRLNRHTII